MTSTIRALARSWPIVLAACLWLVPHVSFAQVFGVNNALVPLALPGVVTGQTMPPLRVGNPGVTIFGAPNGFIGLGQNGLFSVPGAPGGFGPMGGIGPTGMLAAPGIPGGQSALNGFGPIADQRPNMSRQPSLTMYNGQTSLLAVQDFPWYTTNVQVIQGPGGQTAFVPQYQPVPQSTYMPVQAVRSMDGRFTRMSVPYTLSNPSLGPLVPITTYITPVFEDGSQGIPVPMTILALQPSPNLVGINTTVTVPDMGQAFLGGTKQQNEGRMAFGPPILTKFPVFNQPFNIMGWGRDTTRIPVQAPRIIIADFQEP